MGPFKTSTSLMVEQGTGRTPYVRKFSSARHFLSCHQCLDLFFSAADSTVAGGTNNAVGLSLLEDGPCS